MRRIAEPELMLTAQQAIAYAEADFEEAHSNFISCLRGKLVDLPTAGTAIDLGCGPADISIRFARVFPEWTVHGVDGSRAMLACGSEAVANVGIDDRIFLEEAMLQNRRPPLHAFDLVFSNSVLHHLESADTLWNPVHHNVKVGGWVFVMDLMRPESIEHAQGMVEDYREEPSVLKDDYFNSLLASYSLDEVVGQLKQAGLSQLHIATASDQHLMVWGRIAALR